MSDTRRPSRTGKAMIAGKAAFAAVSAAALIGVMAVAGVCRPWSSLVDDAGAGASTSSFSVSTEQIEQYCAGRMALADMNTYGDSEFQTSAGDIASSARYVAFGSVYLAQVEPNVQDADVTPEQLDEAPGDDGVMTLDGVVDDGPRLFDAGLTESEDGTGASGSTASWATEGDLRGLSAASCVVPSLNQSFLLPATRSGVTQELIVANSSDIATAVTLQVWGSSDGEPVSLTTGNTLTVEAHGENSVDLAAGASGHDGLFVTLDSDDTPVSAVVRIVAMDGLDPAGSDYALPIGAAERRLTLPSVNAGDEVRLLVRPERDSDVTVSWITTRGTTQAVEQSVEAGKVTSLDLGEAPDRVVGVRVDSEAPAHASAYVRRTGDGGQSDFMMVNPGVPAASAAVVLPSGIDGDLTLHNTGEQSAEATIHAYAADGEHLADRDMTLDAGASARVPMDDLDGDAAIAVLDDPHQTIVWGARVTNGDVEDAGLAGVANLPSTALTPLRATVLSEPSRAVVR